MCLSSLIPLDCVKLDNVFTYFKQLVHDTLRVYVMCWSFYTMSASTSWVQLMKLGRCAFSPVLLKSLFLYTNLEIFLSILQGRKIDLVFSCRSGMTNSALDIEILKVPRWVWTCLRLSFTTTSLFSSFLCPRCVEHANHTQWKLLKTQRIWMSCRPYIGFISCCTHNSTGCCQDGRSPPCTIFWGMKYKVVGILQESKFTN